MSNKVEKYEVEENLYLLDSSGSASEGERMKRLADKISREVDESFDPEKLQPANSSGDSGR